MFDPILLLSFPFLFWLAQSKPERFLLVWLFLSVFSQDMLVIFGLNLRVISFDRLAFLAGLLALMTTGRLRELFSQPFSKLEKAYLIFAAMFLFEALIKFTPRDAFSVWTNALDTYILPFCFYLLAKYLLTKDGKYNESLERRIVI